MKIPIFSILTKRPVQVDEKEAIIQKPFSWWLFTIKILILWVTVSAVVVFTDKKGYFTADQSNNHVRSKWAFFYDYTATNEVDVIILGNSHIITGIEPYLLSDITSSTCFILGNSGTGIIDAWFQLEEALRHTHPKLVVLETFCINNGTKPDKDVIPYLQSFDAHINRFYKLKYMPYIFRSDSWVEAWSPSVRNHSFLLTDTERIKYNINNPEAPPSKQLDLGRFSRFKTGLEDSTLVKYYRYGSPVKGEEYEISAFTKKYLHKIMKMCEERDIPVIFLTVPMYYMHVSNYEAWNTTLANELQKYPEAKWLNLQMPYDTILYSKEMFENTYEPNQHLSNAGMVVTAYKLAAFIFQNYPNLLPDRSKEKKWIDDFKTTDFFAYHQDMVAGMTGVTSLAKNQKVGDYIIRELVLKENKEDKILVLKIYKQEKMPNAFSIHCYVTIQDKKIVTEIPLKYVKELFNPKHAIYFVKIMKEVDSIEILDFRIADE